MNWGTRVADLWAALDSYTPDEFVAAMDALANERPGDDPAALFERASSLDSTGHSDLAAPLYRQALELGLDGIRRRRAVIQLASSLRNLGEAAEAVALLTAERAAPADELSDAVDAFLALALIDIGQERQAVSVALAALAPHLPRYQRSVGNYASLLIDERRRS